MLAALVIYSHAELTRQKCNFHFADWSSKHDTGEEYTSSVI